MWFLIISVLIDQITKFFACQIQDSITIIPNILSFDYVENRGAVFGIMQGSNYILALISFLICITIVVYIIKQKKNGIRTSLPWYMVLSGGIGNLIDRIIRGYVVDFIATPFIATFNIADSLVVLGVLWLCFLELRQWSFEKKNV